MAASEKMITPREALLLGIVAGEFASTRAFVSQCADRAEPEDWVHRRSFLRFMEIRLRPLVPDLCCVRWLPPQAVSVAGYVEWQGVFDDEGGEYGISRKVPGALFIRASGDVPGVNSVQMARIEVERLLPARIALWVGDAAARSPADGLSFPESAESWIQAFITLKRAFSTEDPETAARAVTSVGKDDDQRISAALRGIAEFNEQQEHFEAGRLFGALVGGYIPGGYCEEFPCYDMFGA